MVEYVIPIKNVKPIELKIQNDYTDPQTIKEKVAIIGTGNYGIALGRCLINADYEVVYGSRNPDPDYLKKCFGPEIKTYCVTSIGKALLECDELAFLAVSAEDSVYQAVVDEVTKISTEFYRRVRPIILIDVSNRTGGQKSDLSNAEILNKLVKCSLPDFKINVVKGLNLLSAYELSQNLLKSKSTLIGGSQIVVPICGDNLKAKEALSVLCKRLGYQTNDMGCLKQSIKLENVNDLLFPGWFYPSVISLLFMVFNFVWTMINYFIFPKNPQTLKQYIDGFSILSHLNKVLGFTSLQLLAWIYFGSVLATIFQLKNGTKYKQFPKLLDIFLKHRKQYGLWAFMFATIHSILSFVVLDPAYLKPWFGSNLQLTLNGDINVISGVLAYILLVLVALSTINSIANSLSWKEWKFVHTKIGLTCLLVATLHTVSMYINIFRLRDTLGFTTVILLTRVKLYAIYFPAIVLLLRFIFGYFPPLSRRIEVIRNGTVNSVKNTNQNSLA